jgi:hypothetical protein
MPSRASIIIGGAFALDMDPILDRRIAQTAMILA